jgi:hypothetical protein
MHAWRAQQPQFVTIRKPLFYLYELVSMRKNESQEPGSDLDSFPYEAARAGAARHRRGN